jgi:hypothetical protein
LPSNTVDLTLEEQEHKPLADSPWRFRPFHIFLLFFCVYFVTAGGHYTSGDGYFKAQWAKQLVSGGPYWKDAHSGAPPKYGIGHSLIAAPGMLAAKVLARYGFRTEAVFYTLLFALNGAFLLYLIAHYLSAIYEPLHVWITIGLIGFATMWWPYTKLDFTEAFVATVFFAAFLLLKRGYLFGGFATAGFLLLLRADSLPLIAILAIWRFLQYPTRRTILAAMAGTAPWLIVFGIVNWLRFGAPWDRGYVGESFSNPMLIGLYGILFSAGKSVFLFSPPLILGFLAWKQFRQRLPQDASLFLTIFICQLIMYSMWWDWSGDDSWGVRFLLTGVVLMTIPCVEIIDRKVLIVSALLLGLIVQIPAVLVAGLNYVLIIHSGTVQRQRIGVDGYNVIDLEEIRFNPNYSQIAGNYALLAQRIGMRRSGTTTVEQKQTGTPVSDALQVVPPEPGCALDFWWCRIINQRRATEPSR